MRKILFAFVSLVAVQSFAGASDLVGTWVTDCVQMSPDGSEFGVTESEFTTDGRAISSAIFFADRLCSGPVLRTEMAPEGKYSATDTTITYTAQDRGHSYEIIIDYSISGLFMSVTPREYKVNGKPQAISKQTTVLRRKN